MNDLVSVIIPVYNVKEYVCDCVDSVLNQTYQNIEIILIDDGSTDGSSEICDKYLQLDERVVVIHKENGGLSDARNVGLDNANGKWILFVDSDDYIHNDLVKIVIKMAQENDVDIVSFFLEKIREESKYNTAMYCRKMKSVNKLYIKTGEEALSDLICLGKDSVTACSKFYKREIFDTIRFPKGRYHEDQYIITDIYLLSKKVLIIDTPLYYYRERSNSIMNSITIKNKYDTLAAYSHGYMRTKKYKKINDAYLKKYLGQIIDIYFLENSKIRKKRLVSAYRNNFKLNLLIASYWKAQILSIVFFVCPRLAKYIHEM